MKTSLSYSRKIYECIDYVPFASSIKSMYSLFYRYVLSSKSIARKALGASFLEKGEIGRHLVLLVPFAGNIIVGIHDLLREETPLSDVDSLSTFTNHSESESSRLSSIAAKTEHHLDEIYRKGCGGSLWSLICSCGRPEDVADR